MRCTELIRATWQIIPELRSILFYHSYCWWKEILHQLIGSFSYHLQGFIHSRWSRISSINSMYMIVFATSPAFFSKLGNKRTYLKRTSTDNHRHRETWVSKPGFQPNIPHPNILFMEEIWVITWEGCETSLLDFFHCGIVLSIATTV